MMLLIAIWINFTKNARESRGSKSSCCRRGSLREGFALRFGASFNQLNWVPPQLPTWLNKLHYLTTTSGALKHIRVCFSVVLFHHWWQEPDVQSLWNHWQCYLPFLAFDSLCTVRSLLQAMLQTEDMLKVYEARLTEEETVYLDLDKVEAYRCGLKVCERTPLWPSSPELMWDSVPNYKVTLSFLEFWGWSNFIGPSLVAVVISSFPGRVSRIHVRK